jgi:ATP-binding protein involved in chromosome partitioning
MKVVTENEVTEILASVIVPDKNDNVINLGLISGIVVKDRMVHIMVETTQKRAPIMEEVRKECEKLAGNIPGIINATAVLTEERETTKVNENPNPKLDLTEDERRIKSKGVSSIIAVASGKGGVGKSTTSVNIALALSRLGKKVGIMDADIYGPSIPRMMGITGQPRSEDGTTLIPMENYDVKCMSMGFMVPEEEPTIWRGPMVMSALEQMLRDVEWAPLDILVVDMPPGTGDAQLTMAQGTELAGAIIVSTPQDIALLDARKGLNMFRQVEVPIIGLIENMSYYICPKCGDEAHIFDNGGAKKTAEKYGCTFLGEIPLDKEIRTTSDAGRPIVVSKTSSPHAKAYMDIAAKVIIEIDQLDKDPEKNN